MIFPAEGEVTLLMRNLGWRWINTIKKTQLTGKTKHKGDHSEATATDYHVKSYPVNRWKVIVRPVLELIPATGREQGWEIHYIKSRIGLSGPQ